MCLCDGRPQRNPNHGPNHTPKPQPHQRRLVEVLLLRGVAAVAVEAEDVVVAEARALATMAVKLATLMTQSALVVQMAWQASTRAASVTPRLAS